MTNKKPSMNKLSLIMMLILLCFFSGCASVNNNMHKDPWFGPDKAKHFFVAAAIGAGSSNSLENNGSSQCEAAAGGIGISLILGAGKEYHDKTVKKTYWSWKDMFWNLVGGTVGSLAASGCR